MALIDNVKALDIASSCRGIPYCAVAVEGVLTGNLDRVTEGHPSYFMEGTGGGGGGQGGTLSRSYPGLAAERIFPSVPGERVFPI
ncbi:MAG: hypothetical protein JXA87_02865 [Thermoleophilia bacterium]|nr:hypothetical protein [Thermoleophilia bacterium]